MELKEVPLSDIRMWEEIEMLAPPSEEDLALFREDLAARGLQFPLVLDEQCRLVDGYRRYRALERLGVRTALCLVRSFQTDREALEFAIRSKLTRQHLHPVDQARLASQLGDTTDAAGRNTRLQEMIAYLPDQLLRLFKSGKLKETVIARLIYEMKSLEKTAGPEGIRHIKDLLDRKESPWVPLATIRRFFLNPDVGADLKRRAVEEKWSVQRMSSVTWDRYVRKQRRNREAMETEARAAMEAFETKYGRIPDEVPEEYHPWAQQKLKHFLDTWGITWDRSLNLEETEMERLVLRHLEREIQAYRENVDQRKRELETRIRELTRKIEHLARQETRETPVSSPDPLEELAAVFRSPLEERWNRMSPELEKAKAQIDQESGLLELKFRSQALYKEYRERLLLLQRKEASRSHPDTDIRLELLSLLPNDWETMPEAEWKRFQRALRIMMHPDRTGSGFAHTSAVINALLDYAETKRSFRASG